LRTSSPACLKDLDSHMPCMLPWCGCPRLVVQPCTTRTPPFLPHCLTISTHTRKCARPHTPCTSAAQRLALRLPCAPLRLALPTPTSSERCSPRPASPGLLWPACAHTLSGSPGSGRTPRGRAQAAPSACVGSMQQGRGGVRPWGR